MELHHYAPRVSEHRLGARGGASADDADDDAVGDDDGDEDEAESNYFELVEYLRFATLNVYMDTRISQRESDGSPENHSIH